MFGKDYAVLRKGVEEMIPLTRKEIYSELKKLGITTTPELKSYLREYYIYYVQAKINTHSPEELIVVNKDNKPKKGA
jgi:hypothetical protein